MYGAFAVSVGVLYKRSTKLVMVLIGLPQIEGMRGAVMRVLSDSPEAADAEMLSKMDEAQLVSQLREARSLLREQDAILLAALFNK